MSIGYRVVSPDSIISITHCYEGVKNRTTGETIIETKATILETDIMTYVISSLIPVNTTTDLHIEETDLLDEFNSKKSEYRAIHKPGQPPKGKFFINQTKIKIRDICPNGVMDISTENPRKITSGSSTVIRTTHKTFVCEGIHHNSTSKYMEIELSDIKATTPTKKSAYTFA